MRLQAQRAARLDEDDFGLGDAALAAAAAGGRQEGEEEEAAEELGASGGEASRKLAAASAKRRKLLHGGVEVEAVAKDLSALTSGGWRVGGCGSCRCVHVCVDNFGTGGALCLRLQTSCISN